MKSDNLYLNSRFIAVNFSIWLAIFVITVSESVFYYQIHDKPTPWVRILVYDAFIMVWSLATPALFMLLSVWHYKKKSWKGFLTKLFFSGLIMCLVIIGGESIIQSAYLQSIDKASTFQAIFIQVISFRLHQNAVLYFTLVGVSIAYLEYKKSRRLEGKQSELNKQLMESELNVLKGQMRPHFLFNSLHAISALVLKNENTKAISMITKFGDLLREGLRLDRSPWITLDEEIKMAKMYLDIHSMRFGNLFSYNIEIENGAERYLVPSLILQPIIENGLIHGIVPNNNQGTLNIQVRIFNKKIEIIISDDGDTYTNDGVLEEGIGLGNTRKRLATLFDNSFELAYGKIKGGIGFYTKIVFPISSTANEA